MFSDDQNVGWDPDGFRTQSRYPGILSFLASLRIFGGDNSSWTKTYPVVRCSYLRTELSIQPPPTHSFVASCVLNHKLISLLLVDTLFSSVTDRAETITTILFTIPSNINMIRVKWTNCVQCKIVAGNKILFATWNRNTGLCYSYEEVIRAYYR